MTCTTIPLNAAKARRRFLCVALPALAAASVACGSTVTDGSSLEGLLERGRDRRPRHDVTEPVATPLIASSASSASGARYLVAATTGRPAIESGVALLEAGGNALDAALGVALDQIVLSGGSWNSLAGIASLLYFDAESGLAHALDGSYRSFAEERDPRSIPAFGTPSGRTALVPGFPAVLQAAQDRFGELGFERLFEAAITHAQDGIVVSDALGAVLASRADVLTRLSATASVYAPGGVVPRVGEVFRQPALAETLRRVASEGVDHLYRGAWAARFVAAVRAEGGQVRLEDLGSYVAEWSEPRCVSHDGRGVCSAGGRNRGGGALLTSLLVAEAAGVPQLGAWHASVDGLYWTVRALQLGLLLDFAPELTPAEPFFLVDQLQGVRRSVDERLNPQQAQRLVEHVAAGRWDAAVAAFSAHLEGSYARRGNTHSDGIVVVDDAGNAAALIHSSNTVNWGTTGINVDGVSIPDSACFQQGALELAGPRGYIGSLLDPALVFEDGQLSLAASSVGNIHYAMFGHLRAFLEQRAPLARVAAEPVISGAPYAERVPPGSVPAELLDAARARGLSVSEGVDPTLPIYWLGIERQVRAPGRHPDPPTTPLLSGVVTPALVGYGGGVEGR
jgi:gamma-glutamyltranspeptidase/glutathione hydrolase